MSLVVVRHARRAPPGSCSPRSLGSGSPTAGTPYLLPAFAAAFLGATQLKNGRFNAGGTIIAVLLLGTGTTGLALAARSAVVAGTCSSASS